MAATPAGPATEPSTSNWRRWLAILVCLTVLGLSAFLGWQWLHDQSERREALRMGEKDFGRAEPLLLRVAQHHPNDAAVAKELALGYFQANRLADSEPYFARWCEANPNDPEPYTQRIVLWVKWSRLRNVVGDARHVLKLQPDNRKLNQQLTRWLMIVGRFDEAEQECQRFLQRWPDDPWVLLILAMVYQRQDRPKEATAIVEHLVHDFADFPEAYVVRGTLYLQANQPAEAIPWLRRAAAMAGPHRREALFELARALNQTGQPKEAEQAMKESRLLQEHEFLREMTGESASGRVHVSTQVRLAEEMLNAGKSEDGLRLLERILDKDPNCAAAHRVMADYYEKQGQSERAAEHRRRQGFTP